MPAQKKRPQKKPRGAPSPVRPARNLVPATKILLAVAAGGRCEFQGCNKYLFEHPLTLKDGNFSELAHIVAFSRLGPRGRDGERPRDINRLGNLMLLCRDDHKLIDDNPGDYSRKTLEQYKADHEARIRHVTDLGPDMKTTVVQFKALIGGDAVEIPAAQIYQAVSPRYPTDRKGYVIDLTSVTTDDDSFMDVGKGTITRETQKLYAPGMDVEETRHVSLFALGPIPLLAFLGSKLSNKITVEFFQRHRDKDEPSPWQWRRTGKRAAYTVRGSKRRARAGNVVLVLSLSGTIDRSYIPKAVQDLPTYTVTLKGQQPNLHFLRRRDDLESFRKTYRDLIARITREHPSVGSVHVFASVPAPVAVSLGHDLLPKVHPALLMYDRDKNEGGFTLRLKVNESTNRRSRRA